MNNINIAPEDREDGSSGWPIFEEKDFSAKTRQKGSDEKRGEYLGYIERIKNGLYKMYDVKSNLITILDKKGVLIKTVQKEAAKLIRYFFR